MDNSVVVTTGDLKQEYEILGPIFFQVSNKGLFSSQLSKLVKKHHSEIEELKKTGSMMQGKADWGFLYGEYSFGMQNEFEKAFVVAVRELQQKAEKLGANAIIHMRQDIDLDTNNFQFFYLQMYGTAVKIKH